MKNFYNFNNLISLADVMSRSSRRTDNLLSNQDATRQKDGKKTATTRQRCTMSSQGLFKKIAMLFAVLVMSIANIGMAWGAVTYHSIVPNIDKTNYETYYLYSNDAAASSTNVVGTAFSSSKLTYTTACSSWVEGNPTGKDNSGSPGDFSAQGFYKTDAGDLKYNGTSMTFHVTNCVGVALLGKGNANTKPLQISVKEKDSSSEVGSVASTTGNSVMVLTYGTTLNASKKYDITITSVSGGNSYAYQIRFEAPDGGVTNPSFSPATGSSLVKSAGTVTLTSSGNTVYYKWSQTDNQYASGAGATLADAADGSGTSPVNATAPSTAGTWYLYAVAKNGGDYSNVVKATYTITNPTHTLTWNLDGGTATGGTAAGAVAEGATLTAPTVTKVGYDFAGWIPSVPATMPADDATYTATWTKVYASGTYQFDGNAELGTAPSKEVTTTTTDYPAFRIDNLFFSTTKIQYETNASAPQDADNYWGWKIKYNGTTNIKFFVENNSDVEVSIGSIGSDCNAKISYTDHGGTAHNNTAISANSHQSYEAKAGTMVTVALTADGSHSVALKRIKITTSSSCTAPSSVAITGTNKYLGGQTISLTANPSGGSGTATYQWQKEINSVWTNLENGGNISGATSANLQISSCGHGNAGQYRCIVSTGATCSRTSSAYGVHVFSIYGKYYSGEYSHNEITWTSGTIGTATIHLNASSTYLFKIWSNDGYYYGNGENNYIIQPVNWDCGTGNHEMRLFTGPEGDYTFTVNIEHGLDGSPYVNLQVAYPSVTHPVTGYVYLTKWWSCYPHFWDGSSNALSPNGYDPLIATYTTICGTDYWYMPALDNYTNVYFKDNATWASATNHGDETSITGNSGKYYTHDGNSWGWHEFTTYTVTTAVSTAGYGTVSAASVTGVACGTSISTSSNTLSVGATNVTATPAAATAEYTYAFDNWAWTPAGATVTSDVTATANFTRTPKSYTLTWNLAGGKVTVAGTGAAVNATGTPNSEVAFGTAITAPTVTKTGYNFSAWSSSVASTMPAANTTYTATWTAKTTTITINTNTANHGSTAPSPITATYGSALPSFTAAAGASGYNLTGYFTTATSGTKVINADGTLVAGTDYADGSGKWKYETSTLTLYPQYEEEAPAPAGDCGEIIKSTFGGTKNTSSTPSTTTFNTTGEIGGTSTSAVIGDAGKLNSEGAYLMLALSTGTFLKGDTIKISSDKSGGVKFATGTPASYTLIGTASTATSGGQPYYFVLAANADNIIIPRGSSSSDYNQNPKIAYVSVHRPCPECDATPSAPTATSNGATAATTQAVSWTDGSNDKWDVYVSTSSSTPAAGVTPTASGLTAKTYTFTGLTASTAYYWWVRSVCDDTHKSSWFAGSSFETSAAAGTTYYLVTSTAQLNTTDTYVIMDDGKAAMMGIATGSNSYLNAITSGFTAAADKSTVTVTSSDVNTLTLKAESSAWNLFGKDSHYITTNGTVSANLYGNAESASGTDDFVFEFGSGKATIKRNVTTDYHIYYTSGTGFNQSTSSTNIRLYTSNSTPVYTVTYDLNGGTGTVPTHRAEKSGTTITLASSAGLTKSGYTFDGWLCNVNSTKYNAGASYTMTAANTTFTAQWEAVSGYTVTYNYNGATGGATPASATGTSVTLPTPTRTGYELDGWYTTAGTKVEDGGETYVPEADITLYARWQEACDAEGVAKSTTDVASTGYTTYQEKGGSNVAFTSTPSLGFKYKDADGNTINNSTTAVVRNNAYKCQISSDSGNKGSIKTNSTFSNVDSISFYFAASDKGGCKIAVWCSTDNFSTDSTSLLSATTYADNNSEFKLKTLAIPSDKKASALTFKFRFTVTSSGKTSYIDSLKVYSSTTSGGTCYHVYYHGNGAESGYVNDTVSYTAGSKATVLNYNYGRYPLAKAGYDFRGWATSASGVVAYSAGQKIDITSADVDLYAVWAPASTALVTWTMGTNTSTWSATATSTTDGTNIPSLSIGTTRTGGSDGKREGATAKVSMAEKEVSSAAAPSNSANFTFTIGATKQVEISKFDCQVFNVASGSRTYKAQISDGAGNVYNSTNTVAVSAEATLTDASFVFGSTKILRGAVTIRVYAWGSGSEFRMGPDVKFYGTVEDYACAMPAAPTISGVSEYVPGETITLTASYDGENYDNLTTYTWYKGVDWATASGTTPVQAAATGESGYTLTIDDCTTGNAGKYWCKVSNGSTCNAHNAVGYDVTVFPAYTITYNLNGGTLDGTEKTSYTSFDDDYTLPIPTKTGYVFAGWYEASDFSGVTVTVLGSGAIGDKNYYAKWGTAVTATWSVTKVDGVLYRGGGGYSVTVVIDQANWDEAPSNGDKDELELTATEGVTLKNIVKSINGEGKAQVTADFDITTALAADATSITFTLDVPASTSYGPAELTKDEDLTSCAGSSTTITIFDGATMSDKTDADDISYKSGTEYTDGTTGFKYKCAGFKKDLVDVTEYTNHGSYSYAMKYGGNSTSYYISMTIPTGYTGSMEIVYGSTDKTRYFAFGTSNSSAANGSNGTKWNATTAAATTLYSATIDDLAAGTYYLLATGDKAIVAKIAMTLYATGGGITPTLTWDDGDADIANDGVSKSTSNDDFIYTASQNKNSLGVITYSSSDATVATVNSTTGQVHLVGAAGTATITATIAASGCFSSANVSYTITVTDDCDDEAGTITTEDLGCSGIKMTVTGHTAAAGVIYQWYKVGTPSDATVGTNQDNFTATEAGSYYVIVTNTGDRHCAKRSTNTITVEAQAAATVTKIVDSWYVKNGRRTPDIELVKTTNATSFTVTSGSITIWESAGSTKTGFGGCGFHMDENGIIYLNGTKDDDGSATTGLTAGDETLTITAIGCGGNASQNITIHKQAATDYKEIAFVVDGEKGKDFDQVTSGHAAGTELYTYLDSVGTAAGKRLFKLTQQNIYSTTDEKAIRQHYSQFDGILITDDPSTNTTPEGDYKTKGYVNAFGTMVDVRPIFTMEAYVSALKNWGSKGIAGNPQSPNPRQYEMRLECKDHEIYGAGLPDPEDGTNVWEEVIDGETFRHVILVDSTKGVYKGVAYNAETAGDKKPALQGFTGEAAGSLLGLGRILEGTLQAAIERQEEPAARLLVMGINAKALQPTCALTNEGKTVIKNILVYLLKTNMEEVDDCSNYFTGKIDDDWSKAGNWSKSALPSSEAKVRILAPCVISGIQPHVLQVSIVNSGNSNIRNTATGSAVCNGTLTIEPDGALIADGKIRSAVAPHFAANDLMPTTPEMLIINTRSDAQAALIFNNEEGLTKATVNLYSLGRKPSSYQYQYFAVPMEVVPVNPAFANETHGGTGIYTYVYSEATSGWTRRKYYDDLFAFEGLGITTKSTVAMNYTMTGTLASTATKEITLTHDGAGLNLVGNSWMAPIQIGALAEDNTDANITQTVYIYCAGRDIVKGAATSGVTETAGQWIAIPFEAAEFETWKAAGKLSVIPAMQAFQIKVADEATLTLDYDKVVRGSTNDLNAKLRAPRRRVAANEVTMTNIRVADSKTHTDLSLFEGDRFSEAFDNGWEAEYMSGDGRSAKLYAETEAGQMAVAAMYDYEGTVVGFAPGQETEYTFSFMGEDNGYYLNDIKLQNSVRISEGETYTFTYEEGDTENRFYISRTPLGNSDVPTGVDNVHEEAKPRKFIYNDKMYILYNGRVFDATGKVVK